jgi:acyl carrier protein
MEKLLEVLKELRATIDYENEKNLIDDGLLDSVDVVTLVGELNEEFDIEITFDDMEAENFNSVEQMWAMIQRLQEGK